MNFLLYIAGLLLYRLQSCMADFRMVSTLFIAFSSDFAWWFLRQVLVLLSELLTAKENNNVADSCVRQELRSPPMGYTLPVHEKAHIAFRRTKKKVSQNN